MESGLEVDVDCPSSGHKLVGKRVKILGDIEGIGAKMAEENKEKKEEEGVEDGKTSEVVKDEKQEQAEEEKTVDQEAKEKTKVYIFLHLVDHCVYIYI